MLTKTGGSILLAHNPPKWVNFARRFTRKAIIAAFEHRLTVLAGYAGSGKTTSLKGVCDVAERFNRRPILMALSGRAAQRMSESTGRRAMTVARYLAGVKDGSVAPGPDTILIVDEASMIDLPMLWRIVRSLGDASLMLVGDPAQLPPIGFGLTFHVLADDDTTPKTVLDRVMRQSAESGIPAVAEAIRSGACPALARFDGKADGVSFIACDAEAAFDEIHKIGARLRVDGVARDDMQIVAPVKAGVAGIEAINRRFHNLRVEARRNAARFFPGRSGVAEGDPIIWTRNDYERGLMNGSLGRIETVDGNDVRAVIDGARVALGPLDGEMIDLSYAISVHKSQGSQWPVVIVPLFRSRILDRTLVYTAVTRAASQVVLVGDRDAFERAIKSPPNALLREVTLGARMSALTEAGGVAMSSDRVGQL
ncbi:ATP-dependent RecD-like DNA helicase [Leisingera sp. ANG59]|uniref:ATP-dependent DNA helicase n=1 Tax=Leisingera sp. ANG59 TaxID=2675221 RepID=UPI001572376D|nr:AAA family ATPase [Leisingera sp. ANG59]NSY41540.1 AAA family ATPase [Leisingera sp. ANG59]